MIDYAALFHHVHPRFFESESIRSLPPEYIFDEMLLPLADFSPDAVTIPVPTHITYGLYTGDIARLHEAVHAVDPDWVQYFTPGNRFFCAFDGDRIASFCILDDFGEYQGQRIGAPGCVGTVPEYRRQGVGLRMVQLATAALKADGYELSYIHYTHLGHWYSRLGYKTILKWNCKGLLPQASPMSDRPMKRGITRREREVTDRDEINGILSRARIVHVGMIDGDRPYVVPMNYGYTLDESGLTLYLHGATAGRKLDVLRVNPCVFIEIDTDIIPFDGASACQHGTCYSSVMGDGVAELVEDAPGKMQALTILMKTQTGKDFVFTEKMVAAVTVIKVKVPEFTAKKRPMPKRN